MIDLYTWPTPNGRKISIMLEELGLPYRVHAIDITQGEEFMSEFLAINPNAKIPAIIDHDGLDGRPITLFDSGASRYGPPWRRDGSACLNFARIYPHFVR